MFFSDNANTEKVSAIIVAAGSSQRMSGENKLLMELDGAPVLAHTLAAFQQCSQISEIVLVCREQDMQEFLSIGKYLGIDKLSAVVRGAQTRQKSVLAGFSAISDDCKYLCIHDGARPLVTEKIISDCLEKAKLHGAATAAVPVKDTIKMVSPQGFVEKTPQRSGLYSVQTPQIFRRALYSRAVENAIQCDLDFTDDCQLVEALGERVYISEGSYSNIKITTADDITVAEAFLEVMEDA